MRKLALALTLAAVAASSPAAAQTTLQLRHVYYSDVQKTEIVGYVLIYCDGTASGNGYPTQWYDEENYECP